MLQNLFTVPIYSEKLFIDNKKLENFIINFSTISQGVIKSNINGWQSKNLVNETKFNEFLSVLDLHLLLFSGLIGVPIDGKITNLWANINGYKDYNLPHIHTDCKLSGVYYVTVPKNSGNIYFTNPMSNSIGLSNFISCREEYFENREILLEDGLLLLFPCWLEHGVYSNMNENEKRISISFNII